MQRTRRTLILIILPPVVGIFYLALSLGAYFALRDTFEKDISPEMEVLRRKAEAAEKGGDNTIKVQSCREILHLVGDRILTRPTLIRIHGYAKDTLAAAEKAQKAEDERVQREAKEAAIQVEEARKRFEEGLKQEQAERAASAQREAQQKKEEERKKAAMERLAEEQRQAEQKRNQQTAQATQRESRERVCQTCEGSGKVRKCDQVIDAATTYGKAVMAARRSNDEILNRATAFDPSMGTGSRIVDRRKQGEWSVIPLGNDLYTIGLNVREAECDDCGGEGTR